MFLGEPVSLDGFRFGSSSCSREDAFDGHTAEHGMTLSGNVTFRLDLGDAPRSSYEVCANEWTGSVTVTPRLASGSESRTHTARLVAQDSVSRATLEVVSWEFYFARRQPFALSTNGTDEVDRIKAEVETNVIAGAKDVGTAVLVPGFNTSAFNRADLFNHYSVAEKDGAELPEITYFYRNNSVR